MPENTNPTNSDDILSSLSETPLEAEVQKKVQDSTQSEVPAGHSLLESLASSWDNNQDTQSPENSLTERQQIQDINIDSLDSLTLFLVKKDYEYVMVEPMQDQVKLTFKLDKITKDTRFISYQNYTKILLKTKQVTGMPVDVTDSSMEGRGEFEIEKQKFKIASKVVPGAGGEKIWLKAKKVDLTLEKQKKKASLGSILWFLAALVFVALIIGGSFVTFIVLNAKTVDDVRFFANLWINLNDINNFISQIVNIIFSVLLFMMTAILSYTLFKFFLTKKVFKRRRMLFGIASLALLMLSFSTGSAWMIVDQKIRQLPNWEEQALGELKIFENDMLVSQYFSRTDALLENTQNLIGPMNLLFDLSTFTENQQRKGVTISKYIWNFGGTIRESFSPEISFLFDRPGNYEISVTAEGTDSAGEAFSQALSDIPSISVWHIIEKQETITSNGGKRVDFDASSLSDLGTVRWYFKDPNAQKDEEYADWTQIEEGYTFIPRKIFFEPMLIGISLESWADGEQMQKVFIIDPDGESNIEGEISASQSLDNDLDFTFKVTGVNTDFADGFIESYVWSIEGRTYNLSGNLENPDESPEVKHAFKDFWEQVVSVTLTDSKWNTKTLSKTLTIQKSLELAAPLVFTDSQNQEISEYRYEQGTHEYFLENIGVPATIKLDARYVRPKNILYALDKVTWDAGDDGNIDATGTSYSYSLPTEGNHVITAEYTFVHRRNEDDVITLKEYIYIEGVKKDAILNLKMELSNNYVPVTVRFDASESYIKNDDIVKFIYDYGDGIVEERDAINPGHRYTQAGDYTVKLTAIGKSWKSYSVEKSLILLPTPQTVKITSSLSKAPVDQGIDFLSSESSGQIIEYFWDFGDGNISTEANPTHSYKSAGIYQVTLKADFSNNNSISDTMEIEIYEEK